MLSCSRQGDVRSFGLRCKNGNGVREYTAQRAEIGTTLQAVVAGQIDVHHA